MRKKTRIKPGKAALREELEEFNAFLGPLAEEYSVGELRQLRYEMDAMAAILLELYMLRRNNRCERREIKF